MLPPETMQTTFSPASPAQRGGDGGGSGPFGDDPVALGQEPDGGGGSPAGRRRAGEEGADRAHISGSRLLPAMPSTKLGW